MGKRRVSKTLDAKKKKLKDDLESDILTGIFTADKIGGDNIEPHDWENEEQEYEMRPQRTQKEVYEGLPIKGSDGRIKRVVMHKEERQEDEETEEETIPKEVGADEYGTREEKEKNDSEANLLPLERLRKIQEDVSELALKIMEDPEENIQCLTRLRKISESKNTVTCKLGIAALIPVFKSLAPSYRIRSLTEAEKKEKVSKEVARLRQFEQNFIHNYSLYVDLLAKLAKVSRLNSLNNKMTKEEDIQVGNLAAKAACELCISSLRFFNFRSQIFAIVIRRLNKVPSNTDDLEIFKMCLKTLETLLADDTAGDISFDVTRILTKTIRDKEYRVDESVVNVFLSLSVLDDFAPSGEEEGEDYKFKKKDRVHLSKKEKKIRKERKGIEKELKRAEQSITSKERERYQGEILKLLLFFYFELLRAGSLPESQASNNASHLTSSVLEGLSRYGRMANLELLGDFIQVLREIMVDVFQNNSLDSSASSGNEGIFSSLEVRKILLCIRTAFSLITSHRTVGRLPLTIDLSDFVAILYGVIVDVSIDCDIEFSHKTLRLADPSPRTFTSGFKPSVNFSTNAELLLRCLDFIFFHSNNGSALRAASFIKRLFIGLLETPEKTTLATLKFVTKLTSRYEESIKGLWNTEERIAGEGSYILGIEKPDREVQLERCNSGAATLWENVLLEKHYSPYVKEAASTIMKNSQVGGP